MKGRWLKSEEKANFEQFERYKGCLISLNRVGLDVRGGLERLANLKLDAEANKKGFPTTAIVILDAQEAQKYIKLGVNIASDVLFQGDAKNLEEASERYSRISKLVDGKDGPSATIKELDEKIQSTTDADLLWEYKREKFRLQTKQKYKEALLKMALEEGGKGVEYT